MLEIQRRGRARQTNRLLFIHDSLWIAGCDRTEAAATSAGVSQNHEREAPARKTFAAVRTFAAHADGVEFFGFQDVIDLAEQRPGGDFPTVFGGQGPSRRPTSDVRSQVHSGFLLT